MFFPFHGPLILFAATVVVAMEFGSGIFMLLSRSANRIPIGGPALIQRGWIDFFVVYFNKLFTPIYMYHLIMFCYSNPEHVAWSVKELTLANTAVALPLLIVVYDMFYAPFHRALHHRSIYGYIHKFHHRQKAPIHGQDDGVNTHPVEFIIGIYLHLLAVYIVPCHVLTVFLFTMVTGYMASINHTRFDIDWGFFAVKEHDTHHRIPNCNYGQYTMVCDRLMGTFRHWIPPIKEERYDVYAALHREGGATPPLPDQPAWCSPEACQANYETVMKSKDAPANCVVVGGNGLVGKALVCMLKQRGASRIVSLDVTLPDLRVPDVDYGKADITDKTQLVEYFRNADVVFHVAALVGPFHPKPAYYKVNYQGTVNVVQACKENNVPRLVMTSSPSTRLDGTNVLNGTEDSLPVLTHGLEEYARTKAMGEKYLLKANSDQLLTCSVSPHQVYGADDVLFLPNFVKAARKGWLRIMGDGNNIISFTASENISHALILAANALEKPTNSPAGQSYICTDGDAQFLWDAINQGVIACGEPSLFTQMHLPLPVLYTIAYPLALITKLTGRQFKLSPFSVSMSTIHRHFDISKLVKEVGYKPIVCFQKEWPKAVKTAVDLTRTKA